MKFTEERLELAFIESLGNEDFDYTPGAQIRIENDVILYINGLPLVVIEFKSAIREDATIYNAYIQLTVRYKRDIPELFKYNAFCVISDGVNNKAGSFFAPYEYYYAWRRITGNEKDFRFCEISARFFAQCYLCWFYRYTNRCNTRCFWRGG